MGSLGGEEDNTTEGVLRKPLEGCKSPEESRERFTSYILILCAACICKMTSSLMFIFLKYPSEKISSFCLKTIGQMANSMSIMTYPRADC